VEVTKILRQGGVEETKILRQGGVEKTIVETPRWGV
jgi:hypothetical protein